MSDDSDRTIASRRTVLKGTAGAVGASAAATTAAAESAAPGLQQRREILQARRELPAKYDAGSLDVALAAEVEPILEALSEEGYIEEPSVAEFDAGFDEAAVAEAEMEGNGVLMGVTYDEPEQTATTTLWARYEGEDFDVRLNARPESGWAVADVVRDGEVTETVTADGSVNEIDATADSCTVCRKDCGPIYSTREYYDGGDFCGNCEVREPTCSECPDMNKCNDSGW